MAKQNNEQRYKEELHCVVALLIYMVYEEGEHALVKLFCRILSLYARQRTNLSTVGNYP
jgi:hypothetical protein